MYDSEPVINSISGDNPYLADILREGMQQGLIRRVEREHVGRARVRPYVEVHWANTDIDSCLFQPLISLVVNLVGEASDAWIDPDANALRLWV